MKLAPLIGFSEVNSYTVILPLEAQGSKRVTGALAGSCAASGRLPGLGPLGRLVLPTSATPQGHQLQARGRPRDGVACPHLSLGPSLSRSPWCIPGWCPEPPAQRSFS